MSAPHHPDRTTHPLPRLAEVESAPQNPPGSYLRILPMDPHRVFVYWKLSDTLTREAHRTVGRPAVPDRLLLRIFQLDGLNSGLSRASATETVPINRNRRETRVHLPRPGGYVVAFLGLQDRQGRFYPLVRSARAALPEAPASPERHTPKRISEAAVLQRASLTGLPPELLRLPGDRSVSRINLLHPEPHATVIPQTPTLNERNVVERALNQRSPQPDPDLETDSSQTAHSQPVFSSATAPSSHSLATGSAYEGGAPLALHAVLVAEAFPRTDERLTVAGIEGKPDRNGRCCWTLPCEDFTAAWNLLKKPTKPAKGAALGSEPQFILELEGVVRDKTYLAMLPRGLTVDAANRFRASRPLPSDHALVPAWSLRHKASSAA
jgi:hypothetical protein